MEGAWGSWGRSPQKDCFFQCNREQRNPLRIRMEADVN